MPKPCSVEDCNTDAHGHGLCPKHLKRLRKYGTTADPDRNYFVGSTLERFLYYSKGRDGEHWIWTGTTNKNSMGELYGVLYDGSKMIYAHRFSYEHFKEPIPYGLVIDHKCRLTLCVNPDHLEAVTDAENRRRGKLGILKKM